MWAFTPQERRGMLFLLITLVVGAAVLSYQKYNPAFAPELLQRNFSEAKSINTSSPTDISFSDSLPKVSTASKEIFTPNGKLNLNTASQEELEKLPHLGPALAKRVIDYRYEKGGFDSVEEIIRVKGIGKKIFAEIKGYLILE
jgi:comEA protein